MSAESLPEEQELLIPAGPPWLVGRLGDQMRSALSHLLVWLPILNPIIQSAQKAQINP